MLIGFGCQAFLVLMQQQLSKTPNPILKEQSESKINTCKGNVVVLGDLKLYEFKSCRQLFSFFEEMKVFRA